MLSIFSRIKEQPLEEVELRVMGGPLYTKLSTALNHARKTCPLDAYNKIEDIEKTNGWVVCLYYRSLFEGGYIKAGRREKKPSKKNEKMNSYFDSSSQRFIPTHKKWVYHASEPETQKMLLLWDPIGNEDRSSKLIQS